MAKSQQGTGDLSPTTARKEFCKQPASPEEDKQSKELQPCETQSTESSHSLPGPPTLRDCEIRYLYCLKLLICGNLLYSNRK